MPAKSIRILGHTFKLLESDPGLWAEGGMGRSNVQTLTITLNPTMPHEAQASTLLHEVVHMISDLNALELTESQTSTIAMGFFDFFVENPTLVRSYFDKE